MNLTPREIRGGNARGGGSSGGDGGETQGGGGGEGGKRQKTTTAAAVFSRRRSAARPGTESGDGYRGSSAIIGAESSFFFPFFFPPFFRRVILIWERLFVFAARAYLVTRRGDAAAAAAAASAMHHGAARIEGYTSASRESVRGSRGAAGRRGDGRGGGQEEVGAMAREEEGERGNAIGQFPATRSFPYTERPPHCIDRRPPDGAVSNPFYRFNEYNFLASPPLDPPLPAVGPRRSSRSPPPLIAAATITTTANLLSSGTNAESRLPGATVPPPISRVMEMIIEFG